jgi:hypothetical protein
MPTPFGANPLDVIGTQGQQALLVAASDCSEKILHNLNVFLGAHRHLSFPGTPD